MTAEHVEEKNIISNFVVSAVPAGSTLYSEGSFVRRLFSPKPFEVAMFRRTYGPKVLYYEVPLLRKLLCSEHSIFRKALHYMDSMLQDSLVRSSSSPGAMFRTSIFRKSPLPHTGCILRRSFSPKFPQF